MVGRTVPSSEFSAGTTPQSACPLSTAAKTSGKEGHGTGSTVPPKAANTPSWENDPSGPRKAAFGRYCTPRHREINSR